MNSKIDIKKLIYISKKVGNSLIDYKKKNLIKFKYINKELKTSADNFANEKFKYLIKKYFKEYDIISEEDDTSNNIINKNFTGFIIDPIDGTNSFFENYKTYVTQIAFAENGRIKIGVVYSPELRMLFYAEKGKGAFYNNKLIESKNLNYKITLIDNSPRPSKYIQSLMNINNIKTYHESGSIGLKMSLIAINKADLMIKPDTFKIWDIAAPLVILNEVKGSLYEINKKRIIIDKINKNDFIGLIACSSRISIGDIKFKDNELKK